MTDLSATFAFPASEEIAGDILIHVNEMRGVRATLDESGSSWTIAATVTPPFDASRLDQVLNVIRYQAPDAEKVT